MKKAVLPAVVSNSFYAKIKCGDTLLQISRSIRVEPKGLKFEPCFFVDEF